MAQRAEIVDEMQNPGTRREEFGATEMTVSAETSAMALAAQAEAMVKARFIVAMQRPRDIDDVRARMLKACKRPGFAKAAIYHKPIGDGIEGFSIRFAEEALRCMRNMSTEVTTLFDDKKKRLVRVLVIDTESNNSYHTDITIEKTVERSRLREGQQPIAVRTNSQGRKTYIVEATEDDLLNKQGALVSKAIRTNGLRHIPGDILDECKALVYETADKEDAKDPDAERKRICDGFSELGVMPSQLKDYLAHDIGTASPAELKQLRKVYAAIRDGEATWQDCLDEQIAARAPKTGEVVDQKPQTHSTNGSVKDRVKAKVEPPAPSQPQTASVQAPEPSSRPTAADPSAPPPPPPRRIREPGED